jgi:hypothetical protein
MSFIFRTLTILFVISGAVFLVYAVFSSQFVLREVAFVEHRPHSSPDSRTGNGSPSPSGGTSPPAGTPRIGSTTERADQINKERRRIEELDRLQSTPQGDFVQPNKEASKGEPPDASCRSRLARKGVILPPKTACIEVDTVIKNLSTAEYRFNKPDEAFVHEPFRVVLVLPTAPEQDVVSPFTLTQGPVAKRTAPFAQNMEATLRGDPDLKISPSGPQERVTTSFQPTTWEWTITPEKSGEKSLIIEVNAQLVLGTERNRVQLRTIYETIHVQVHFGHMVLASLLWFVTSIYGLLVGLATLAIGGLGIYQLLHHKKAEEIPGADLLAHQNHKSHDQRAEHHE